MEDAPSGRGSTSPSEYFADVELGALPASRAATVAEMRALLSRIQPGQVQPADARCKVEDDGRLTLLMSHHTTGTQLVLMVDDDELMLIWPGGTQCEPAWGPAICGSIEALLVGRNTVSLWRRFRRVIRTSTVVWDADGTRRSLGTLQAPGWVAALLRRLPGHAHSMDVSISFQESTEFRQPRVTEQ